ncbi:MAG: hypothetical protein KKE23_00210 [Nanoarchaeota archaeon]|nr:hypothetical protein [Nanoarchaeota archaeon]
MTKTMKTLNVHPKMKKLLTAMFVLLILAVPTALAEMSVTVDDVSVWETSLSVEAGDTLPVQVMYVLDENASDVVVEVELSYGHGKKTEVSTNPVDALSGVVYKKNLKLKLADDVETSASGEEYSLLVQIKDGKGHVLESAEYDLTVQRKNDLLEIQRVIVPSVLEAGKTAKMTVVIKNIGSDKQEDVYLKISSTELGLYEEEYAGDIKAMDEDSNEDVTTIDVPLRISKDALKGTYTLTVEVHNDNLDVKTTKTVTVNGIQKAADSTDVVAVEKSLDLKQGSTGVYQLHLLNLGNAAQTYSVSIRGLDGWASYDVNPLSVKLNPDSSQLVDLALTVSDKAMAGEHTFTVAVESDGKTVKELTLTTNIEKSTWKVDTMLISVVVLAIVLVALVAVLVKSRKSEDETEVEESYY